MKLKIIVICHFLFMNIGNSYSQHDATRDAVRFLAREKVEDSFKTLKKIKNPLYYSPIAEAEKWYVKTMLFCYQNDLDNAFDAAMKAVENGLPVERLLINHGGLFSKLYKHDKFLNWLGENKKNLIHGPMLGAVTDSSARFWVRTSSETDIVVELVKKNKSNIFFKAVSKTLKVNDYTTVVEVKGLKSNTTYEYSVVVGGEKTGKKAVFTTFPKQYKPSKFHIAFGGGAGFTEKNERMWDTMNDFDPLATLLLGDNVYIDDPEHALTQLYSYYRRQSQPEFRKFVANNSIYSIYDDHDFGEDDCIPGSQIEFPKWKREVWNVFKQNWNNPSYGGGEKKPGCWYSFYIGDTQFIMLDTRYYRDLESGNMLGDEQKEWLFKTLKLSKGKFKILVSSVPWSPGVKPGSNDTWDGFVNQREEIFSFIEKNKVEGIVLLSADRHRSDMRMIARPNAYDLYEGMSSRLTNVHIHPLIEDAVGSQFIMGYNEDCSFGMLKFNTKKRDPEMTYQIINIDGQVVGKETIKFSQLTFKSKNNIKLD